jgi:hypothetical protein
MQTFTLVNPNTGSILLTGEVRGINDALRRVSKYLGKQINYQNIEGGAKLTFTYLLDGKISVVIMSSAYFFDWARIANDKRQLVD